MDHFGQAIDDLPIVIRVLTADLQTSFQNIGQEVYTTPRNKDRGLGDAELFSPAACKIDIGVPATRSTIVH